jgi:hypothetical protein
MTLQPDTGWKLVAFQFEFEFQAYLSGLSINFMRSSVI